MSRQKHEVMEILAYVPEVVIDASEWSVEELQDFASASSITNSRLFIKNTKHLTCDELERIIKIKGDTAKNNYVALEL
ncbi:MAG: hypothetical protein KAJ31_06525 [Deltaproteobacteria bacterium]|nr:hypothetical protein [Deltaproteobacteria bacterium]MCK5709300.1 hypothetical protein [Deltaproteobacteria bacterium]